MSTNRETHRAACGYGGQRSPTHALLAAGILGIPSARRYSRTLPVGSSRASPEGPWRIVLSAAAAGDANRTATGDIYLEVEPRASR